MDEYPLQEPMLTWEDLNQDFESNIREYKEIEDIA